jgi:hypothetical protein
MLRQLLLLSICGLTPACMEGPALEKTVSSQEDVVVKRDAALRQTYYTISAGDCQISWTVYESEVGVVRHRSACGLNLSEQIPLIGKVLRKIMDSGANAATFRTLTWGRLYPDGTRDATLAVRLALAAWRSPDWDPVRGRPRRGDINGWVRDVANEALIYEELRPVFRQSGLEIRLAAVEKVLVQKAELLPFFASLRQAGVRPEDKVPFDCQAWFSVRVPGAPNR